MNETTQHAGGAGPSHRGVEIGVALFMALLGFIAIFGSTKVGFGWGAEGPQAGFFPFYVGWIVVLSCAVNLYAILTRNEDGKFAEWGQLRQVAAVLIPTTVYVLIIPRIGIYVSSALLIGVFMKWLGRYRWDIVVAVSIAVPILTFLMFEIWFLVPLPKGPLEHALGY